MGKIKFDVYVFIKNHTYSEKDRGTLFIIDTDIPPSLIEVNDAALIFYEALNQVSKYFLQRDYDGYIVNGIEKHI